MSVAYEEDFVGWAHDAAESLRAGQFRSLDIDHLAEEVEDLAKKDRREARSRCGVILMHLAKWQMQPERRERSTWLSTLSTQRGVLSDVLEDSPSLRRHLQEQLEKLYQRALTEALQETQLTQHSMPAQCPFTLEQVLDDHFFPE